MQVVIITKDGQYIDAFRKESDYFLNRDIRDWAANYVIDNNDEMIDIEYFDKNGQIIHDENHDTISLYGDNGLIVFNYIIKTI